MIKRAGAQFPENRKSGKWWPGPINFENAGMFYYNFQLSIEVC